jgi:hypothetical protein
MQEQKAAPAERAASEADEPRRRGRTGMYVASFVLLMGAGAALVASSLGSLRSVGLLRVSAGLSVAAIVLGALSILLPRRS